ncbi:cyclin-dependent kinase G-2-like isoform X2 [Bidens hawaiensis]|uniref:cyclin-dependent kinase G-2-like isoform X2 n=1 Tax=Bidens hawaiensis TaxID=980011 RepID=UPI0040491CF4
MSKYMAAGRHGGYRDSEVREREGEYDRVKNGGDQGYDRGKNQVRGRVRVRDNNKDREVVNGGSGGGYRSGSRSFSGGDGGGLRRGDQRIRVGDREPGELSCESGSDEGVESEMNGKNNEGVKMENNSQSDSGKKRKFSPIVWERDDKEASNSSMVRSLPANVVLPPPPPLPKSYRRSSVVPAAVVQNSPVENNKILSSGNTPVDTGKRDSPGFEPDIVKHDDSPGFKSHVGLSSSLPQEEDLGYNQDVDPPEEDYMPTRTIRSSRWASDANSSSDEGELSDDNKIQQRKGSVEIRSRKQSSSPEVGERYRESSERIRGRSSESVEAGVNDLSDDDLERKDYMDIDDEDKKDGTDLSLSESDSENGDGSQGAPDAGGPSVRSVNMLHGCRSVDEFERLNKIDEGTYGVVYRAKDKKTGEIVALKKVKMEKEREGFPLTSLREINILLSFHHPSIVDVKEVVVGSNLDSMFMVMEYMEHDLKALMETMKQPFSQSEVKCLMLQLFEGTKYLHDNWVLHRDLKTSNLLLNNRGELKICDFGLSRQYGSPLKPYTHLVVTLWYRAPELLLGTKLYSTAIDMWSLGCIMAELLSKQPLFNGKTEFDQLDKIFKTLGTPNETIWPGYSKLPGVKVNFVKHQLPALGDFLV